MERIRYLAVSLAALLISLSLQGQGFSFENHIFSQDALSVQAFAQDSRGMMWIGTSNGLFSYDGYDFRPCPLSAERTRISVNCMLLIDDRILLLGTGGGVAAFDIAARQPVLPFLDISKEVLSLYEDSTGTIWAGTVEGLYRYRQSDTLPVFVPLDSRPEREAPIVYSIDEMDSVLYLGTYWGFCKYDVSGMTAEYLFPSSSPWAVSSYSVLADRDNGRVWFGSRRRLCSYSPSEGARVEQEDLFTVKTMYLQKNGTLVIGSEGAMYTYADGQLNITRHDSRTQNTLANNDVNVFFEDSGGNLWVGTGLGVSLMSTNRRSIDVSTYYLTGQPEGNQITSLCIDSQGRFWLGGPNGLIFVERPFNAVDFRSRWYSEDSRQWALPNNNVKAIFEDSDQNVWILTDSGLNRYDEPTGRILRYFVRGRGGAIPSGHFNGICEGLDGSLWLFSSQDGVLRLSRESLQARSGGGIIFSEKVYDSSCGLQSNSILDGTVDRLGKVWVLDSKGGLSVLDTDTGTAGAMDLEGVAVSRILQDTDGNVWAAYRGGVLQVGPVSREVRRTAILHENQDPLDLVQANDEIWVLYPDGIACLDRVNSNTRRFVRMTELGYGLFYDRRWSAVLVGRNDGVTLFFQGSPRGEGEKGRQVGITDIIIDGVSYPTVDGRPVWDCDRIVLDHSQHDISLKISNFGFTKESKDIFAWRIANKKDSWHFLDKSSNVVAPGTVKRGRYDLVLGYVGDDGEVASATRQIRIVKKASWWASTPLLCLYSLLAIALIMAFINYRNMKSRLRFEQMEREQAQRQVETKINFITEISHEFKTPLSLILAPLSELISKTDPSDEKYKSLDIINNNALKLSSLVHQVITFYRDGNDAEVELVQSHVDLVPFAQKVFRAHAEGLKSRAITFNFNSSHSSLYSFVDVVKLESALNNLLSNAAKFTPDGGEISMMIGLDKDRKNVLISVADNGCGISPEEQKYIFQRFYQASVGKSQGGTGLGLYMARNFVEMQGGTLEVESDGEHGSKFTIKLPVPQHQEAAAPTTKKVQAKDVDERPVLLIVEDNLDLADFISHIFSKDYRCIVAHDGSEGYQSAVDNTPDLIITDIMMPVMDGLEMCRKLKTNVRTATIPVIMLTAKDDRDTELESIRMKVEAFIPKPFDVSILQSRVHQLISLKRNIEQKVKYEYISTPKEEQSFSQSEKFLTTVTDIIEDNLSDPEFNVNVLSEKAGMTQKFLYRKITKLTGMTTVEYIRTIRLKKAAMLLSDNKFAVSEVMYMVGFSNQSYFSKCFSQYFGVTPQQYKSGLRGEKVQS